MSEMNFNYNTSQKQGVEGKTVPLLPVDRRITEAFLSKARTPKQIEAFHIWASMSREAPVILPMLQAVQVLQVEQTMGIQQAVR